MIFVFIVTFLRLYFLSLNHIELYSLLNLLLNNLIIAQVLVEMTLLIAIAT